MDFRNGILGMGGIGGMSAMNPGVEGLLGQYYDPDQLRSLQMKRGLLGAGMALLGQEPSPMPINLGQSLAAGFKGGIEGADQARDEYMNNAMMGRKMQFENEARAWDMEQQAQKRQEWEAAQQERSAREAWIASQPPDKQRIFRAFPELAGKAELNKMYPDPQNASGGKYYGNLIPYQKQDGTMGYAVQGQDGSIKDLPIPDGGTSFIDPYEKSYMQSYGKGRGDNAADQASAATGDIAAAQSALDIIGQIRNHPYIDRGTGASSILNTVRGTGGYDFQNVVNQSKAQAFLSAIVELRGMGALSNAEGDTATKAIARLDTATSKEAFLKALQDYEKIVNDGLARARQLQNMGPLPRQKNTQEPTNLKQKYGLE